MADAQFAIDIAASMSGGAQTVDELDQLTRELMSGGKNSDVFQQAIQTVARSLVDASAAAKQANAALAAGEAEYSRLELAAVQVAKAADKASKSNGGIMPPEAVAFVKAGNDALAAQADKLRALEQHAKSASAEETRLASTSKNLDTLNGHVNKTLAEQGEQFEKLRGALASSGGALGQVASKALAPVQSFAKLSATMGASGAAAVILSAVMVALTATIIAAGVATLTWSIGLSDASRSAALATEATQAMHPELKALDGEMTKLTASTGLHADALNDLALQLKAAHVSAADMPAALQAAADAEAALGKGGSAQFIQNIEAGKKSVAELAKETTASLGGIVAKQMLSLGAQSARLHDNLAGMFGGLKIDSLLGEFANVISDFDSSTVLGKELKATFENLFQPLVAGAQTATVAVEAFVLRAAILAVRAYLAFKPYSAVIKDIGLAVAVAAAVFALTFTPAIIAAGVAMAGVVGTALLAAAPFLAIGAAVVAAYEAFQNWDKIKAFLLGLAKDFNTIGGQIIQGFIDGIVSGATHAAAAVGDMAHSALHAAESALGIASPSKAMGKIAGFTVDGYTNSIVARTPDAQQATAALVAPPSPADAAAAGGGLASVASPADGPSKAAPAAASAGGGPSITIQPGAIVITGVQGAEDLEDKLAGILTRIFEGDALQAGA